MPVIKPNVSISQYQNFIREVYGLSNDRQFGVGEMVSNIERFLMRGLKGIRKNDPEKTKFNLLISFSWFMSLMNQLHIGIEEELWKRFPCVCSYCASSPCCCKEKKVKTRKTALPGNNAKKPKTLADFQLMFQRIYPADTRTLEHAGVHLAEEMGEFSESILIYRASHKESDFKNIFSEAADFISCLLGVFNSLGINAAIELSKMFKQNCHICKKAPCQCGFDLVANFKS
jgi:NTP pyrophosphatase (non-canonical NTP hydrolase)